MLYFVNPCRLMLLMLLAVNGTLSAQTAPVKNERGKQFTYKVIDAAAHTFGYDIYSDGRAIIHQPTIPSLPGNSGFLRRGDAEKVARLVIEKLQQGTMPPTIGARDLEKLKIRQ